MTSFQDEVAAELLNLLRTGVPARGVHLTVRELVVMRIERGPLGARQVSDTVQVVVRAACRMVWERGASEDVVETVCRACLDAVRGHGGESTRWLAAATGAVYIVLDDVARERADEPSWRWLAGRLPRG